MSLYFFPRVMVALFLSKEVQRPWQKDPGRRRLIREMSTNLNREIHSNPDCKNSSLLRQAQILSSTRPCIHRVSRQSQWGNLKEICQSEMGRLHRNGWLPQTLAYTTKRNQAMGEFARFSHRAWKHLRTGRAVAWLREPVLR